MLLPRTYRYILDRCGIVIYSVLYAQVITVISSQILSMQHKKTPQAFLEFLWSAETKITLWLSSPKVCTGEKRRYVLIPEPFTNY